MATTTPYTISVLVGSARPGRVGLPVANAIAQKLRERGHTVHIIDPLEYIGIQTFTERYRFLKEPHADLVKIAKLLTESDGFVAVTPEYNHTYSTQIKIYLDTYFNEFKFKPMAMISYSPGSFGGVRAIENLRSTANVLGISVVPTAAFLPNVQDHFDEKGNLVNERTKKSFDGVVREFEWYLQALANQRKLDPSILPK